MLLFLLVYRAPVFVIHALTIHRKPPHVSCAANIAAYMNLRCHKPIQPCLVLAYIKPINKINGVYHENLVHPFQFRYFFSNHLLSASYAVIFCVLFIQYCKPSCDCSRSPVSHESPNLMCLKTGCDLHD